MAAFLRPVFKWVFNKVFAVTTSVGIGYEAGKYLNSGKNTITTQKETTIVKNEQEHINIFEILFIICIVLGLCVLCVILKKLVNYVRKVLKVNENINRAYQIAEMELKEVKICDSKDQNQSTSTNLKFSS